MKEDNIKNRRVPNCFRLMETAAGVPKKGSRVLKSTIATLCAHGAGQFGNLKGLLSGKVLKNSLRKVALIIISIGVFAGARSQDKAALVKEFNKVMSFSVHPYLHYSTYTTLEASPVLQKEDTFSDKGEFFKNGNDIYYKSSREEIFLEDSFFIRINNEKKTIWISKVDVTSKDKINLLPLSSGKMQKLFEKEYAVNKIAVDDKSSRLNFHPSSQSLSGITTDIGLQYSDKKKTPELMQLTVSMKQAVSDEMVQQVKNNNEERKLIQVIDGQTYLVRQQSVTIRFGNIDYSKEEARKIPSWKSRISFDPAGGDFRGKGNYSDYEVTKTF